MPLRSAGPDSRAPAVLWGFNPEASIWATEEGGWWWGRGDATGSVALAGTGMSVVAAMAPAASLSVAMETLLEKYPLDASLMGLRGVSCWGSCVEQGRASGLSDWRSGAGLRPGTPTWEGKGGGVQRGVRGCITFRHQREECD